MGKMYRCLLLLTLAFFTFACEKGDDAPAPTPTPDVDRTVLVYLASDNNLYRFALQNLNDMKSAMEGLDGNLLVYIDEANGTSRLSKIESDGTEPRDRNLRKGKFRFGRRAPTGGRPCADALSGRVVRSDSLVSWHGMDSGRDRRDRYEPAVCAVRETPKHTL